MKKIIIFGIVSAICLLSCKGPKGDVGPAGSNGTNGINGTNGTNGTNGNANVIQLTYGSKTNTGFTIYPLPQEYKNIYSKASISVYVQLSDGVWYFLPGTTYTAGNIYSVRLDSNLEIAVIRTTDVSKTQEVFSKTRIIVIPASTFENARKSNLDFTNYEEVVKALNPVTINQ